MNKIAVAQELVKIAKLLVGMPMMHVDPGVELRGQITPVLRRQLGLEGAAARANPKFSRLLTNISDPNETEGPDHCKFHYFAIYQDQTGEFVGGNAWGRLGYPNTYRAMELERSSYYPDVEHAVLSKMMRKMSERGYEETRFAA